MSITIRAYNVLFGDCLLLSWDEADGEHHAWIDFGNFQNDPNAVFEDIYNDALQRTKGKLDLVVITHRHMDHLEGFYSLRKRFKKDFSIKRLWCAYVTPHLDAQFKIAAQAFAAMRTSPVWLEDGELGMLHRNNFGAYGLSIEDRMEEILQDLPYDQAYDVFRDANLTSAMPPGVHRLKIQVLAPEEDSSVYFDPLLESLRMHNALDAVFTKARGAPASGSAGDPYVLPKGQAAQDSELMRLADFARLRRKLQTGGLDLLKAVDRTRNNTSVVLALTYGGERFLLCGDAEEKSWELMLKSAANVRSDCIKVAHHGSINASPEKSFKAVFKQKKEWNCAIISTDPTRYTETNEVPKKEVLAGWKDRLKRKDLMLRTDDVLLGGYVEMTY